MVTSPTREMAPSRVSNGTRHRNGYCCAVGVAGDGVYARLQRFIDHHRACPSAGLSYGLAIRVETSDRVLVLRCTCGGHLEVVPSFTEMAMLMRTAFINRISVEVSVRPDVPQAPFCAAAAGDQGFRAWSRGSWNSALRFLNGCVARHAAAGEFQAGTAWPAVGLSSNPSDTGVTRRDMDVASGVAGRK